MGLLSVGKASEDGGPHGEGIRRGQLARGWGRIVLTFGRLEGGRGSAMKGTGGRGEGEFGAEESGERGTKESAREHRPRERFNDKRAVGPCKKPERWRTFRQHSPTT